ncbi:glycoside hydrolase family 16 protein [Runella sp.]|jgi:beta-glucanase (GH16 family)|uniref:glycoside hydrolase family 16 protein n=1 Tax=Runella sp. TaxID=1960881 RepID=UPI00261FFC5A|nr:glycoside hydrolase family 16 protein [Runella sp.]
MRVFLSLTIASLVIFALSCQKKEEYGPLPDFPNTVAPYEFASTPAWQDEFDIDGLPDAAKWDYDVGGNGWGNNELQYYTKANPKNARVENGKLIIEAIKESFNSNNYTSARLVTKKKGDWLYGKVVVRAKLPKGTGTWPAIWMLATEQTYGTAYWPDNGEIDIMEHVGFDPNVIHGTAHTKAYYFSIGTQKTATTIVATAMSDFHDYILEWTPSEIKISVDDKNYFSFQKESSEWQKWPFDKPFHLLLNIAVGGNWGGQKGVDNSIFPQRMEVDYVRVFPLKKN